MASRPQLSWQPSFAVLIYVAVAVAWIPTGQAIEDAVSYDAWFLSLPLVSIVVGFVAGRVWAPALAVIPALITIPSWGAGCGGDDVCFGEAVFFLLVPLCAVGLGLGLLVRRVLPVLPGAVRRAARRLCSTIEERNQ